MTRDGSWSSGSWKSSPWRDGPRRPGADSGKANADTGKVPPGPTGAKALASPAATNVLAGPASGTRLADARLADLREWHIVEARCASCRHVGRLRPKQLTAFIARRRRHLAGQTRLADIQPRFACSECGNRAGNEIAVVAIERNVWGAAQTARSAGTP